jgi:hypothetical protein
LYADIPPLGISGGNCIAGAGWKGFEFFRMSLAGLCEVPVVPEPAPGMFSYKFIPRTGALGEAAVEELGYEASVAQAAGYAVPVPVSQQRGRGSIAFHAARWEDMPLQYPIVNFLAAMPVVEILSASLTRTAIRG